VKSEITLEKNILGVIRNRDPLVYLKNV